ncbi:MAG: endolytic transglycosylase MltG, partial [Coriobacteriales bacterium]|nr:endolytic transglycosylase MltG [Coriobacteriales bacterium]
LFEPAPVVASGEEVPVFILEGSTGAEIAGILKEAGVITSETSFIGVIQDRGVEGRLLPGRYTMYTGMTDDQALDVLIAGPNATEEGNKLTIPEGLTLEATAAKVEAACGIPADEFIAEAHSADAYVADYPFLEGVYDNSMEGFLYPKTYMIPAGASAKDVICVLLNQFVIETAELDMSYAESKNLTLYDVVKMASMIEKETAAPEERPLVSSVLYNRLHEGMFLQICATVVYTIGLENYDGHPLLETDLAIESPYNTYLNAGLPAGPICSPRVESIEAAAHPSETDYLYYVLTSKEGTHTFCTTYEEFEAANVVYAELFAIPG